MVTPTLLFSTNSSRIRRIEPHNQAHQRCDVAQRTDKELNYDCALTLDTQTPPFDELLSLKGRCAVVTGGGPGLGEGVVRRVGGGGAPPHVRAQGFAWGAGG